MKIFRQNPPSPMKALCAIGLLAPCLLAANAQAATATPATFSVSMAVNSPSCSVSTSNATVTLPTGTSQAQTIGGYFTTNGLTTPAQKSGWVTSATLNQTATITCTTASTPITSFVVQPGTGAVIDNGGLNKPLFNLVDTATPPNKAANGILIAAYEQVSVTDGGTVRAGSALDYTSANNANYVPYTTVFTTSAVANGTATVVWRPVFTNNSQPNVAMGTATGGAFNAPGTIIVNY